VHDVGRQDLLAAMVRFDDNGVERTVFDEQ